MRIAIIDNYDSFTYNLSHIVEQYCDECIVMRNDQVDWQSIESCDKIVFSPGPGLPSDVQIMTKIIDRYKSTKPILGVCLGMQCIAEYFSASLYNLNEIVHGVPKPTLVLAPYDPLFQNIPQQFNSARYHSWAVSKENFPNCLQITAIDENEVIMAIKHIQFPICGVQFHPESIMTEYGKQLLKNWILQSK